MSKILVADDEVALATLLEKSLTSMGYEIVGKAYSGESAIKMARDFRPDLILMDIVMPGTIDGIDAAKTIKADLNIPVIFLTDPTNDKFVERAKKVGPFVYIAKPFHESEIKAAVEGALYKRDLERQLREAEEQLKRKITEHKRAEEELKREKNFSENIVATVPDSLLVLDKDLRIESANRTFYEKFQEEPGKVIGRSIADILGDKDGKLSAELTKLFGTVDMQENFEWHYQSEKLGNRIFHLRARGIVIAEERYYMRDILVVLEDITERKQTEEQSKVSLDEREVLLKEIHHRIKNNLQIVSSLLDMHSLRTYDPQTVDLLKEARAKIHAMALIHSQLYQSDRLAQVNMGSYIRELVAHLSQVYAIQKESIRSDIEHSEVYLTISQAVPCALVLHELTSNAFKHAFKDRQNGLIKISMLGSTDDKTLIRVEDDGIGIPEEIDVYKTDTMGLKLVRNLVQEQLKGNIKVKRDNGTKVFIDFKNLEEEIGHA